MLKKSKKDKLIKAAQIHKDDTGSPEVQISILNKRIEELSSHLKKNRKDKHSKKGLLKMVGDVKRQKDYLRLKSPKRFAATSKKSK